MPSTDRSLVGAGRSVILTDSVRLTGSYDAPSNDRRAFPVGLGVRFPPVVIGSSINDG